MVVPLAGTWIETILFLCSPLPRKSFPLRERGLKLLYEIEIITSMKSFPLRERGLKLNAMLTFISTVSSFPLRERGLKPGMEKTLELLRPVVPLAGTWIETFSVALSILTKRCRSPCGNVD